MRCQLLLKDIDSILDRPPMSLRQKIHWALLCNTIRHCFTLVQLDRELNWLSLKRGAHLNTIPVSLRKIAFCICLLTLFVIADCNIIRNAM